MEHNGWIIIKIKPLPVNYTISKDEASKIAKRLNVNFANEKFDLNEFTTGINVELEHGLRSPSTNVTNNDPLLTGKIALAHLNEFPDYYTRLTKLEDEAKAYWQNKK